MFDGMSRSLVTLSLLLLTLPSCVAAIGNRGSTWNTLPASARPLMQEKVEAARRVVELCQRKCDALKAQHESGQVDMHTLTDAEIAVEEARIRLLDCRATLQAMEGSKKE